jgi:hypothetical protein
METGAELSQEAAINQSNNINDAAAASLRVFITHGPDVFTPVVHYESCPQRAFMHNIHTEFPPFAHIYGSAAVDV